MRSSTALRCNYDVNIATMHRWLVEHMELDGVPVTYALLDKMVEARRRKGLLGEESEDNFRLRIDYRALERAYHAACSLPTQADTSETRYPDYIGPALAKAYNASLVIIIVFVIIAVLYWAAGIEQL